MESGCLHFIPGSNKGVVQAQKSLNIQVPVVVRLKGTNEAEGQAILSKATGLIPAAGMAEAAKKIVEATHPGSP